jgi:hypothetical protein
MEIIEWPGAVMLLVRKSNHDLKSWLTPGKKRKEEKGNH